MSADSTAFASFSRLHPSSISESLEIARLIHAMERAGVVLRRGLNRRIERETAVIHRILDRHMLLATKNFERRQAQSGESWCLSANLNGAPLFFVVAPLGAVVKGIVPVSVPSVIYRAERRDRVRSLARSGCPQRVLILGSSAAAEGVVADSSPEGLAVNVRASEMSAVGQTCIVRYLDGDRRGEQGSAEIRHCQPSLDRSGWVRLGLAISRTTVSDAISFERRSQIVPGTRIERARDSISYFANSMRVASARTLRFFERRSRSIAHLELVDYANEQGEPIRAIVDSWGERKSSPVVLIPPAWGKTKETLLPLAATIVHSFSLARRGVTVVRFDGIRRRGESFNDPECRFPGREYRRFTFSQGVRDIHATLDFLYGASGFEPSTVILITFSAASIDGRRAIAADRDGRIGGWINVVGAPDLQSAMRVVSGGIDFLGGFERGVRFGFQEVQGVTVDMDYAAGDALSERMAFIEDAKRDIASIKVPISWIHGRFDAWMDPQRVRQVLSAGDTRNRRLIEVPTGHQLRSSRQALEVFQLVASEVGRMTGGTPIPRARLDLPALLRRGQAERQRLPKQSFDSRAFWRDYLVGRNGHLGIELMTGTSAYRCLMETQIDELALGSGAKIADLGSGTGAFAQYVLQADRRPEGLRIFEVDCVREALVRARIRTRPLTLQGSGDVQFLQSNLNLSGESSGIPLRDASQDAVLASLVLSYVADPGALLRESARILKANGRLVISSLVADADTSKIFAEGAAELRSGRARDLFGVHGEADLEPSLRSFLNDAARLLELEERGVFQFWEATALRRLVRDAGFEVVRTRSTFGEPGQAIVLTARKYQ